ncbi:MAG: hypothetical protein KQH63_02675 [Desulfobulbaceae bacterium]|nr:hypothetical protein [Desulfobulbaceae bacterium]
MRKWQLKCLQGACVTFMAAGMVPFIGVGKSLAADSSCIQCHTDEDMLEENLSQVKAKGSSMTSGSG